VLGVRALSSAVLSLGVAVCLCGCSGGGEPTGLPIRDDFSDCSAGWSTDTDEFVSLSCTDGAYRMLIKNPLKPQTARIFVVSEGVGSLSVESDATRVAGPRGLGSEEFLLYGVGCWRSQVQGYVFLVSPDGAWGIAKFAPGASLMTGLAGSTTGTAIPGLARTNRIRGVCVGGGQAPTTLALYVNGKQIAVTEDRDGFDSFPGFGPFVYSSERGTDVRFDNLVARELTTTETQRTQTASRAP
jgi:hypothetical protein